MATTIISVAVHVCVCVCVCACARACVCVCVRVHVVPKQGAVYTGYPSKCRVCIGNCLGRFMPMYSVWCRPGVVHWWSIYMASQVV